MCHLADQISGPTFMTSKFMTPEQFAELAQAGYNRIPVYREVLADLDTPLSTYLKLGSGPYSYLFESVQGGEKWGRYSII
jgi:anthranilate synthase component 1